MNYQVLISGEQDAKVAEKRRAVYLRPFLLFWLNSLFAEVIFLAVGILIMTGTRDLFYKVMWTVTIRREGLETSGWLWIVDRKVELRKLKETYHHLLKELQWPRDLKTLSTPLKALLADLLDELQELNLPRIASTLRICIRAENAEATATSSRSTLDEFTTDHYYMSHWFFDLLETLLERGHLWCGRLDSEEELTSIFHCEGATTVFTSSATSFDDIPRPWMAQNFISCEVIPGARAADGVTELVHTMETIHGIWYPVGNASRRFLFPWGDQ
ncbi:uncharacterized protein CDV56_108776 [Aspergillus thermomutatus]|uniref:Uncharacterized protein n=1 Tax=Aspergillus thermomutatus TaxID=41047 RepID=A0A397HVA7_ASPTH|nr:uncharacterized protein CDV56_108776 [Aspergillus thermomutatus]RHZ67155.1 hypothetical protein CDV56_108776 [Aspergillus thermomutatus]